MSVDWKRRLQPSLFKQLIKQEEEAIYARAQRDKAQLFGDDALIFKESTTPFGHTLSSWRLK